MEQQAQSPRITTDAQFTYAGREVKVGKRLGSGLTSVVYKAEFGGRDVALKVLAPNSSAFIRQKFLREFDHISELRRRWSEKYPNEPHVVPEVMGRDINETQPFILMELIPGETVEKFLTRKQSLEEEEAIALATQLGKLLIVLHDSYNMCYADIKFENMWCINPLPGQKLPRLMMTDWNVLSDRTESGVRLDLFYASIFFFRMLTGSVPPYRLGVVTAKWENNESVEKLTDATHRFLTKALHSNINWRYPSAQDWTKSIAELLSWWSSEPENLNELAGEALDQAKAQRDQNDYAQAGVNYQRARDLLQVSEKKNPGSHVLKTLQSRAGEGWQQTSPLELGLRYFKSGFRREAMGEFDKGAELSGTDEKEILRRWYWVAAAANEMRLEVFNRQLERMVQGVDALVSRNVIQAETILDTLVQEFVLSNEIPPRPLTALRDEANIIHLIENAQLPRQTGNYDQAVEYIERAHQLWRALPAKPKTAWAEDWGDISALLQQVKNEKETIGQSRLYGSKAQQALSLGDWDNAAGLFQAALSVLPEDQETIKSWEFAVKERLQAGDLQSSEKLTERALGLKGCQSISALWKIARNLKHLDDLARQAEIDTLVAESAQFRTENTGNDLAVGSIYKNVLHTGLRAALERFMFDKATQLIAVARQANVNWVEEFQFEYDKSSKDVEEKLNTQRQQQLTEQINRALRYHQENDLQAARLAAEIVDEVESLNKPIDPDYSQNQSYFKAIRARKARLEQQQAERSLHAQAQIEEISNELQRIDGQIASRKSKMDTLDPADPIDQRVLPEHMQIMASLALQGLTQIHRWQNLSSEDIQAQKKLLDYKSLLNKYGFSAWTYLEQEVNSGKQKFSGKLGEIREQIKKGNISAVEDILNSSGLVDKTSAEYQQLDVEVKEIKAFISWCRKQLPSPLGEEIPQQLSQEPTQPKKDRLTELQDWLAKPIPSVYWERHAIGLIPQLQWQVEQKLEELKSAHATGNAFLSTLYDLLRTRALQRQTQRAAGEPLAEPRDPASEASVVEQAAKLVNTRGDRQTQAKELLARIDRLPLSYMPDPKKFVARQFAGEAKKQRTSPLWPILSFLLLCGLIAVGYLYLSATIAAPTPTDVTGETLVQTLVAAELATRAPKTSVAPMQATPTFTPAATKIQPTVTQPPVSKFAVDPATLYSFASLPEWADVKYVIDNTAAIFTPPFVAPGSPWKSFNTSGYGNTMAFVDAPCSADCTVEWKMDLPLNQAGLYEVYVSDPKENSLTSAPITYEVLSNGQVLKPLAGSNSVSQKIPLPTKPQYEWISIGIYRLEAGKPITVRLNLKILKTISAYAPVGIDAVMIAALPQPVELPPAMTSAENVKGKTLLFWADNLHAEYSFGSLWEVQARSKSNWLGAHQIDIKKLNLAQAVATWNLPHALVGPGKYELMIFIPPSGTVQVVPEVLVDDLYAKVEPKPGPFDLKEKGGTFFPLGVVEVPAGTHTLKVRLASPYGLKEGNMVIGTLVVFAVGDEKPTAIEQPTPTPAETGSAPNQ